MSLTIYADFSCPNCYLASRRADLLVAAGTDVDWRAVEHRHHLPVAGRRLDGVARDGLARDMAAATTLLLPGEPMPWSTPEFVPRTRAAVSAYAEAYGAGVAPDVRRLLFGLYWVDGADIGNPAVLRGPLVGPILRGHSETVPLRESGLAVSVDGGPITTGAYRRIRDWAAEWRGIGARLPALVASGRTLVGADALRYLGERATALRAPLAPALPDPRHYPPARVHPAAGWASQTGASWAHACRTGGSPATCHLG